MVQNDFTVFEKGLLPLCKIYSKIQRKKTSPELNTFLKIRRVKKDPRGKVSVWVVFSQLLKEISYISSISGAPKPCLVDQNLFVENYMPQKWVISMQIPNGKRQ